MKFEVTLTSDEYGALLKFPGGSAQQRLRALIRFWMAVCAEKDKRDSASSKEHLKLVETPPQA